MNQSTLMSHMPSYNNTFSFANSFAQYPNPTHHRMTHELYTAEANAIDMSIDALYLHELHHLEVSDKTTELAF